MKRLIALLLAASMLASCVPAAIAEEILGQQPEAFEPETEVFFSEGGLSPEEAVDDPDGDLDFGLFESTGFEEDLPFELFTEEETENTDGGFVFDEEADDALFDEAGQDEGAGEPVFEEEPADGGNESESGPDALAEAESEELQDMMARTAEEDAPETEEAQVQEETGAEQKTGPEEQTDEPQGEDTEGKKPGQAGLPVVSLSSMPAYRLTEETEGARVKSQGTYQYSAVVGEIVVLQATFGKAIKSGKWQYTTNNGKTWKTFTGGVTESDGSKVRYLGFVAEKKHFKYGFRYLARLTNGAEAKTNKAKLKDRLARKSKAKTVVSVAMNGEAKLSLQANYAVGFQWQVSTNKGKTWKNLSGSAYSVQKVPDDIQFDYEGDDPSYTVSPSGGSSTLSFTVTSGEFKRVYRCKAIGTSGAASYGYYWIVKQPTSPTVRHLSTAKLSFRAAGARKYQWQYLSGTKWKNCSGKAAKKATYSFRMTRSMARRTYRCRYYGYDKKWRASKQVRINAVIPTYRALLIGQNYKGNDHRIDVLPGSSNNLKGMKAVLANDKEAAYAVTAKANLTKAGIRSAISTTFAGATEKDVSLFYYSGHGCNGYVTDYYGNTHYYPQYLGGLIGFDKITLKSDELYELLSRIPGKKIVVIDACFSGSMIGQNEGGLTSRSVSATPEDFNDAFINGFTPKLQSRGGELATENFYVLTACSKSQESWQIGWPVNGKYRWGGWMTRYLMEGAGIDFFSFKKTGLKADSNKNKTLTLNEIYKYIKQKIASERKNTWWITWNQSTKIWPSGSGQPVFAR